MTFNLRRWWQQRRERRMLLRPYVVNAVPMTYTPSHPLLEFAQQKGTNLMDPILRAALTMAIERHGMKHFAEAVTPQLYETLPPQMAQMAQAQQIPAINISGLDIQNREIWYLGSIFPATKSGFLVVHACIMLNGEIIVRPYQEMQQFVMMFGLVPMPPMR